METASSPPEPPRKRRYPRLELQAAVKVQHSGAGLLLPVRNVSRGGVLVAASGHDLSAFPLGTTHSLTIFDPDDPTREARIEARVVRHDNTGMAVSWDHSTDAVATVSTFLDRFYSKR